MSVKFLETEEIRVSAEAFLDQWHPERLIPTPIEEIIELGMKLDIIPFRGLRERFDVEGFLSTDLTSITVDEHILEKVINRYRFTLAHEIGHYALHADYIRAHAPADVENWKQSITAISATDYSRMEFQARTFAALILVPRDALIITVGEAREQAERSGLDLGELRDVGGDFVAGWIARQFQVSTEVIARRLTNESLWQE